MDRVQKYVLTLQAELELKAEDRGTLSELMKRWSACTRYACGSALGDWKRILRKRVPAHGAGAMVEGNTASWGNPLPEEAEYKYPSPDSAVKSG